MSITSYLVIVVLGLGTIVALIVGFSWLFTRHWCKPRRRLPKKTPTDDDLPYEPVTFTSQGVRLKGWFIPADDNSAPRPTIILVHGWSHNATQMLPVAHRLHEAGFGVLLYDARGHGTSGGDGSITLLKFTEDLIAAVDYLYRRPEVDMTCLGTVGHSMGGSGAIVATSMEPRIRALVSSSAFADPVALARDVMRARHIPRWPFVARLPYHRALDRPYYGRHRPPKSIWPDNRACAAHPRRLGPIHTTFQHGSPLRAGTSGTCAEMASPCLPPFGCHSGSRLCIAGYRFPT